ncbi:MAG: right-handed parallel beta-helix repeat-containing protein, partial [Candidatus Thermoplasmatota archaeon]|nr:right-handed parallel beta-helix repeat-containing protein [Candidatus Thermoplasmatota archaeon]
MRKVLVVGIILLFIGASVVSSINLDNHIVKVTSQSIDTNGLVAYWNFNEGSGTIAHDNSGNGHNGTIYNASWTTGKIGKALYFDGNYDYVLQNPFNGFPTAQITVAFWMNTSDTTQEDGCAFSYACTNATNEFVITNYSNFTFVIHDQLVGNSGISTNDGFWHHIAVTWNSSDGQLLFYKDGILEFSGTGFIGGLLSPNGSVAIGGDQDSVGGGWESYQFFKGIIDEVRIYNRTLTQDEIQDLITQPEIVYVDDDFNYSTPGWGYDHFSSIQAGIDAADVGGTVFVYSGIYVENVFIAYSVNLVGEDRNTTIIKDPDGEPIPGGDWTLRIGWDGEGVNDVFISSFTVSDGLSDSIAVEDSEHITIENCISTDANLGFYLADNRNVTIDNCLISECTYGLDLREITNKYCEVKYSTFSNITTLSIWTEYGSNNNKIHHNNFISYTGDLAYDSFNNIWYDPFTQEGNYWSDYTGEDNDGDGIGDTPYNISGGSNQDLYPLMHPFELYYILNISLDTHEVNEGTTFNVTVKTLGGTIAPYAQVHFDKQTYSTGPNGTTVITAPSVPEDIVYPIVASKPGYTSDTDTILVKDVPQELTKSFIFGKYRNLTEESGYITIEGINLWLVLFNP